MSKARNEYKGIITHKRRYLDLYYIHLQQFGIPIQLTSSYVILIWEWKEFCHLIKLYTNQVDVVPLCIVTSPFLLIFELSHVPCLFGAICQQMPSIQTLLKHSGLVCNCCLYFDIIRNFHCFKTPLGPSSFASVLH